MGLKKYENIFNIILKISLVVTLIIIGIILLKSNNIYSICIGLGLLIGIIIYGLKKINKIIKEKLSKNKKVEKIFYIICSILFSLIFIWQIIINTNDLLKEYSIQTKLDHYTTGTITQINDDSIIIKCLIDKKETLLKCLVDNTENFKDLTDEIYVYYEQNNLNNCSITPPQLVKMLYVCTYLAITICTFLLAFFPIKNLYRIYKPKKEEDEVKVKVAKN